MKTLMVLITLVILSCQGPDFSPNFNDGKHDGGLVAPQCPDDWECLEEDTCLAEDGTVYSDIYYRCPYKDEICCEPYVEDAGADGGDSG
jgi:hypothetical protein